MRWIRALTAVLVMAALVWVMPSCKQAQKESARQAVPEPEEPRTHEGFVYSPMSSDSVIWSRNQHERDEFGEDWIRGIGVEPRASWKGCPCCPVALDSGGCCIPCLVYDASRYEGQKTSKDMAKDPIDLITIEHRFPVPGTVFATAACLITRDPNSTDPLEVVFGLTMHGSEGMKPEAKVSEVSRVIPPASELADGGRWIPFRQEFHVDAAMTTFSLVGRAPAGAKGDMAQTRIISLTFLPELN